MTAMPEPDSDGIYAFPDLSEVEYDEDSGAWIAWRFRRDTKFMRLFQALLEPDGEIRLFGSPEAAARALAEPVEKAQ